MKIFLVDLDNTLVNTEKLKKYRDNNQWKEVFKNINLTTINHATLRLLDEMKDGKIIVVTSSPSGYAKKVLSYHKIQYDGLIGYHDVSKHKPYPDPYLLAITPYINELEAIFIYGDEETDFIAADSLKVLLEKKGKKIEITKIGCSFYKDNNLKNIDTIRS
ncbi:HAD-IA family hydrolase [Fusobacterium sp. THCT1E2]